MSRTKYALGIGDVIEIVTRRGFVYAQITHRHRVYGLLLRVVSGVYERRPPMSEILESSLLFHAFVNVELGLKQGLFRVVGNANVARDASNLPKFKWGIPTTPGRPRDWWLWNGDSFDRVHLGSELTPAQASLPLEELVTPDVLIARLETDWTPAEADSRSGFEALEERATVPAASGKAVHYLRFTSRQAASAAAEDLASSGFRSEAQDEPDGYLLFVVGSPRYLDRDADTLTRLARRHRGEYEGHQQSVARQDA
jgi:hypothetical protein